VHPPDQACDRRERGVRLRPGRVRRDGDVARHGREALPPVVVHAPWFGHAPEPRGSQRREVLVHRCRVRAGGSQHQVAAPHHGAGVGDAAVEEVVVVSAHGRAPGAGRRPVRGVSPYLRVGVPAPRPLAAPAYLMEDVGVRWSPEPQVPS